MEAFDKSYLIIFFLNNDEKCKMYENVVVPLKVYKKADDCYKLFGVEPL